MKRSDRFGPVQQFAGTRERDAAAALARALEELREHQARLQQLIDYRDEYGRDMRLHGDTARDPAWLRNYQIFLSQLNAGIAQQQELIAERESRVRAARQAWEQATQRVQAMDGAVERMRRQEAREDERSEQRLADDQVRPRRR